MGKLKKANILPNVDYVPNLSIDPEIYYRGVIGVTVSERMRPVLVKSFISQLHTPYVEIKPLHHSPQVIERRGDGIIVQICVQHYVELEKEILGFSEGVTVLKHDRLRHSIKRRLMAMQWRPWAMPILQAIPVLLSTGFDG